MITDVSGPDIRPRLRGALRGVRICCVGLGFSMLVFAPGLALWGWLAAEPSVFAGMWDPFDWVHQYAWRNHFPAGPALSVVCIAAVLIVMSFYRYWIRNRSFDPLVLLSPRVLAPCAVLYFAALSFGLPPFYRLVMGHYPVTPAVPMVVASWVSGFGGVVALLAAIPVERLTRKGLPVIAGGVVVGAVAALVLAMIAVRAGDDRRYVDASVAGAVDVPAAPTTFGQRRFSVKVSDWHGVPENQPDVQVAAAGAGFVVFHGGQVTGYGSDGTERWHYRRSGPGRVSVMGLRVFDGGRTVVAAVTAGPTYDEHVLVGLDAVTGRQLWTTRSTLQEPEADSFHPYRNTHGVAGREPSPFLIANRSSDKAAWTRIDTRTGKPMWTVDAPVGRDCYGRVADTQTLIATATVCLGEDTADVGLVVLNPESGQRVWQTTLAKALPHGNDQYLQLRVTPAGSDGVEVYYGRPSRTEVNRYVNVGGHVVRDLGSGYVRASPQPADVFIVAHDAGSGASDLSLYDANGLQRCTLSPGIDLAGDPMGDYSDYLPLAQQVLVFDWKSDSMQMIDKNTCAPGDSRPVSEASWLAAAPGAVLIERSDANGTYVDGYA